MRGFLPPFAGLLLFAVVFHPGVASAQTRPTYLDQPATVRVFGTPSTDDRLPLIVVLPSSGSSAETIFASLRRSIPIASYVVLLPQGSPTTSDFLPNFSAYVGWYETRLLADLRDALANQPVDPARVFMLGFSLGGDLSCALLTRHPELFRGAFIMSSRCSSSPSSRARATLKAHDARIAFAIGNEDDASRVAGISRAYEQLRAAHITTRFARFEGGHQLPRDQALLDESFAMLFATDADRE